MYETITTNKVLTSRQAWNYDNIPFLFTFDNLPKKRKRRIPTDENAPQMITIKELANRTGLSDSSIRTLCKTNKIQYIRTGVKYLINYDRFIDYLNGTI